MPKIKCPVNDVSNIQEAVRLLNSDEEEDKLRLNDDCTCVIPYNIELSREQISELTSGTIRAGEGKYSSDTLTPIEDVITRTGADGEKYVAGFFLDIHDLWKMMYEHRRYASAKGFSDTEMEIVRIVESADTDRITTSEIKSNRPISDLSAGTVHNALNNLVDKKLIKKHERGLYSYIGP